MVYFFLFIARAWADPIQDPPHILPTLQDLLSLPAPVSVGLGYVAEPTHLPFQSAFGFAHGLELAIQLSTGFSHEQTETWKEWDHWIFTLDLQQYYSNQDLTAQLGVVNGPQEIANDNGVYLGELSLTRNPGLGGWYIKTGYISINADFLAPDITGLYTHVSFNNQYNISVNLFPISPINSLGGVVGYLLPNELMFKAGIYQLNALRADMSTRGWGFEVDSTDGLVEIVQLEGSLGAGTERVAICPPTDHTFSWHAERCLQDDSVVNELPSGYWQVGAFFSQGEEKQDERTNSHGVYANITLPVQMDIAVSHRFWLSGMYGFQPENNPIPLWLGTGWITQGLFERRPLDLIVAGLVWNQFSLDDMRNREILIELEYGIVLSDTIVVQPNVQWYIDTPAIDTQPVTLGVGLHIGL